MCCVGTSQVVEFIADQAQTLGSSITALCAVSECTKSFSNGVGTIVGKSADIQASRFKKVHRHAQMVQNIFTGLSSELVSLNFGIQSLSETPEETELRDQRRISGQATPAQL